MTQMNLHFIVLVLCPTSLLFLFTLTTLSPDRGRCYQLASEHSGAFSSYRDSCFPQWLVETT